jgi:callose synthase
MYDSVVDVSRRMWWQRNIDGYWTGYANNRLHEYLYICAAFIVPEVLALVLFILPWVRNFIETTSWRIFHVLTWWFQVCTDSLIPLVLCLDS